MTKHCGFKRIHGEADTTWRLSVVCRVVLIGMTQQDGAVIVRRISQGFGSCRNGACVSSFQTSDAGASKFPRLRGKYCAGFPRCLSPDAIV